METSRVKLAFCENTEHGCMGSLLFDKRTTIQLSSVSKESGLDRVVLKL
jgi:hypothetical protein